MILQAYTHPILFPNDSMDIGTIVIYEQQLFEIIDVYRELVYYAPLPIVITREIN